MSQCLNTVRSNHRKNTVTVVLWEPFEFGMGEAPKMHMQLIINTARRKHTVYCSNTHKAVLGVSAACCLLFRPLACRLPSVTHWRVMDDDAPSIYPLLKLSSQINESRDGEQNPIHANKAARCIRFNGFHLTRAKSKHVKCVFNVTRRHPHTLDALIWGLVDVCMKGFSPVVKLDGTLSPCGDWEAVMCRTYWDWTRSHNLEPARTHAHTRLPSTPFLIWRSLF